MTQLCPIWNYTAPTTIAHFTTLTPCKSCILFSLLNQNTQTLRWKTIVNTPRPDPPPLNTIPYLLHKHPPPFPFLVMLTPLLSSVPIPNDSHAQHFHFTLPHSTHNLAQTHIRDTYDRKYTTRIPHTALPLRLIHLHYLHNALHTIYHTPTPDTIMYHYLYLTCQLRSV